MLGHSHNFEEIGQVVYALGEAGNRALSPVVRRLIKLLWSLGIFTIRLHQGTTGAQQPTYPDGDVFLCVNRIGKPSATGLTPATVPALNFSRPRVHLLLRPLLVLLTRLPGSCLTRVCPGSRPLRGLLPV